MMQFDELKKMRVEENNICEMTTTCSDANESSAKIVAGVKSSSTTTSVGEDTAVIELH